MAEQDELEPIKPAHMPQWTVNVIGGYHILAVLLIVYLLVAIWPEKEMQITLPTSVSATATAPQGATGAGAAGDATGTAAPSSQPQQPAGGVGASAAESKAGAPPPEQAKQAAKSPAQAGAPQETSWLDSVCTALRNNFEIKLLVIVALAGALGAYVHSAQSFVTFVGNRRIVSSWLWWYLLRPFIGMALAVVLYLVVRGGFFPATANLASVNVFGFAALAGMTGMFSKEATDKLKELFENMFQTKDGVKRQDKPTAKEPGEEEAGKKK